MHESAKPKSDTVVFDQKDCVFLSHVVGVTVGQTLDIKNSDPTGHNTNIVGKRLQPDRFRQAASIPFKVQKEEAVPAQGRLQHPSLDGRLHAAAQERLLRGDRRRGPFEIANVPAGEQLEFQVWHESGAAAGSGLVGDDARRARI